MRAAGGQPGSGAGLGERVPLDTAHKPSLWASVADSYYHARTLFRDGNPAGAIRMAGAANRLVPPARTHARTAARAERLTVKIDSW